MPTESTPATDAAGGRAPTTARAWPPIGAAAAFEVFATEGGWCVCGGDLQAMIFPTGAAAERQARRLARGLAGLGRDATVHVYDGARTLVGTITYFSADQRDVAPPRIRPGAAC